MFRRILFIGILLFNSSSYANKCSFYFSEKSVDLSDGRELYRFPEKAYELVESQPMRVGPLNRFTPAYRVKLVLADLLGKSTEVDTLIKRGVQGKMTDAMAVLMNAKKVGENNLLKAVEMINNNQKEFGLAFASLKLTTQLLAEHGQWQLAFDTLTRMRNLKGQSFEQIQWVLESQLYVMIKRNKFDQWDQIYENYDSILGLMQKEPDHWLQIAMQKIELSREYTDSKIEVIIAEDASPIHATPFWIDYVFMRHHGPIPSRPSNTEYYQ